MQEQELKPQQTGFTLIELVIVIVIIASLAVVVFFALNPVKRLQDARDAHRQADIESVFHAIHQYIVDKGNLPTGLVNDGIERQLGTGTAVQCSPITSGSCNVPVDTPCADISAPLGKFLKSIPHDPLTGTDMVTGYSVSVDSNNIVTVNACGTEN
jgi:prepilin-type N-terminal cleavage/methylation domain-containing protein